MDELDQLWVPEVKDWRLNERHYGDCIGETGLDRCMALMPLADPNLATPISECFIQSPRALTLGCTASELTMCIPTPNLQVSGHVSCHLILQS